MEFFIRLTFIMLEITQAKLVAMGKLYNKLDGYYKP